MFRQTFLLSFAFALLFTACNCSSSGSNVDEDVHPLLAAMGDLENSCKDAASKILYKSLSKIGQIKGKIEQAASTCTELSCETVTISVAAIKGNFEALRELYKYDAEYQTEDEAVVEMAGAALSAVSGYFVNLVTAVYHESKENASKVISNAYSLLFVQLAKKLEKFPEATDRFLDQFAQRVSTIEMKKVFWELILTQKFYAVADAHCIVQLAKKLKLNQLPKKLAEEFAEIFCINASKLKLEKEEEKTTFVNSVKELFPKDTFNPAPASPISAVVNGVSSMWNATKGWFSPAVEATKAADEDERQALEDEEKMAETVFTESFKFLIVVPDLGGSGESKELEDVETTPVIDEKVKERNADMLLKTFDKIDELDDNQLRQLMMATLKKYVGRKIALLNVRQALVKFTGRIYERIGVELTTLQEDVTMLAKVLGQTGVVAWSGKVLNSLSTNNALVYPEVFANGISFEVFRRYANPIVLVKWMHAVSGLENVSQQVRDGITNVKDVGLKALDRLLNPPHDDGTFLGMNGVVA